MRREISPDMLNYNKFPGPKFSYYDQKIQSDGIQLELVDNYRDGFKLETFEQRFSDILLKYDYILGDWSSDELRLRGFYKDDKVVRSDSKISRLDEYLKEYCNFGCAYFLLENPNPQAPKAQDSDTFKRRRKDKKSKASHKSDNQKSAQNFKKKERNRKPYSTKTKKQRATQKDWQTSDSKDNKPHFTIRKKGKS